MAREQLDRWERRTSGVLLAGAAVFLAAYAWPILQPSLPPVARTGCSTATVVVWVAFAVDLLVRLRLAERRWAFLRSNWMDVVTLAVPMLRPLRALRVLVALNVIGRRGRPFTRGRVIAGVGCAVTVVCFVAALAVLEAERDAPKGNITTFGDAIWWSATTVATVGYGDRYPTTGEGRVIAIALMVTGIALLGVVTAALASWFVEKVGEVKAAEIRTQDEVAQLAAEVSALRQELRQQSKLSTS